MKKPASQIQFRWKCSLHVKIPAGRNTARYAGWALAAALLTALAGVLAPLAAWFAAVP